MSDAARVTWRELYGDSKHERVPMSEEEIRWALRNAATCAVGWAAQVERGAAETVVPACPHCRRGPTTERRSLGPAAEVHAWRMVAYHVRAATRAAWELARERGSAP